MLFCLPMLAEVGLGEAGATGGLDAQAGALVAALGLRTVGARLLALLVFPLLFRLILLRIGVGRGRVAVLLLDQLCALDRERAVDREGRLHLHLLRVRLCRQLHGVRPQLRGRATWKGLVVSVCRLQVELALAEERHHLEQIHQRVLREHHCRFLCRHHLHVAVIVARRWHGEPTNFHRDGVGVFDLELPDFVQWRQEGRLQGAATGNALVGVHGRRQFLAAERLGAHLLHPGDPRRPAAHLHRINRRHRQAASQLDGVQHVADLLHHRLAHIQEVASVDGAPEVLVLHEALAGDAGIGVGGQDLLTLPDGVLQLEEGLFVA
mmetsp:Transcript_11374/g.32198  ORF Transcript_11374/g.32198 Transcript_11374/m.32198 type:complete len:322 (-) Transcript_11374:205-1170(-)